MKNVKLLLVDGFLINSLMIYFHLIISYQASSIIFADIIAFLISCGSREKDKIILEVKKKQQQQRSKSIHRSGRLEG